MYQIKQQNLLKWKFRANNLQKGKQRFKEGKQGKGTQRGKRQTKDGKPISREKDAGRFLYSVLNIKRG